jgi:hypothetical protein
MVHLKAASKLRWKRFTTGLQAFHVGHWDAAYANLDWAVVGWGDDTELGDLGDAAGEDLALRPAKRRRLARMPHESPDSATRVARRVSAAAALAELVHRRGLERASGKPVMSVARTEDR